MSPKNRRIKPCAEMLIGIDIFKQLNYEQRQKLAELCRCRCYQSGQEVISYRAVSEEVYFIVNGQVQAIVFSTTGKQLVLNDIDSGDLFGELSAIDKQPRSAFVITMTEAVICSMSANNFWHVLRHYPAVNEAILQRLSEKVRQLCGRVVEISTLPVKSRIHAEILRLALRYPNLNNTVVINPAPTHADIANHIGTHREAVSREMGELKNLGILQRDCNSIIVVKDMKRLQNLVHNASDSPLPWLKAS